MRKNNAIIVVQRVVSAACGSDDGAPIESGSPGAGAAVMIPCVRA